MEWRQKLMGSGSSRGTAKAHAHMMSNVDHVLYNDCGWRHFFEIQHKCYTFLTLQRLSSSAHFGALASGHGKITQQHGG